MRNYIKTLKKHGLSRDPRGRKWCRLLFDYPKHSLRCVACCHLTKWPSGSFICCNWNLWYYWFCLMKLELKREGKTRIKCFAFFFLTVFLHWSGWEQDHLIKAVLHFLCSSWFHFGSGFILIIIQWLFCITIFHALNIHIKCRSALPLFHNNCYNSHLVQLSKLVLPSMQGQWTWLRRENTNYFISLFDFRLKYLK
jgi:hypothetical protein